LRDNDLEFGTDTYRRTSEGILQRAFAFRGLDVDLSMEADMSITRRLALPSILFVLACAAVPALADAPKEAHGIVTSIRGGSLAINLPSDTDVTFRFDDKTSVVARGAGRKMRQAQADGAAGIKLADVLPIGVSVRVSYEERDGQRYARRIVSLPSNGR